MSPILLDNMDKTPPVYDPKKAKQLLAEAGYPNGFDTILYSPWGRYPKDKEIATLVANQLSQVGIRTKVEVFEWAAYIAKLKKRDYPGMALMGWGSPTGDADNFLFPCFHSKMQVSILNLASYSNPKVDGLLLKARVEMDHEKQSRMYHEILKIIHGDYPWIPMNHPMQIFAMKKELKGFIANPIEIVLFNKVHK